MLPSADGSPLSGGSDDHTRFVPRADRVNGHTRIVAPADRFDARFDDRTTMVPMVRRPSRARTLLPWAGFGLVAVVVVAATTAWASALRGPDDPLLANATPPAVFVEPAASASTSSAPVDETTVPAAATRRPARPSPAAVVPPKPAPVVVTTTTAKATATAAPTSVKATKAPTREPAAIQNPTASPCVGLFCSSPTGANNAPAATAN